MCWISEVSEATRTSVSFWSSFGLVDGIKKEKPDASKVVLAGCLTAVHVAVQRTAKGPQPRPSSWLWPADVTALLEYIKRLYIRSLGRRHYYVHILFLLLLAEFCYSFDCCCRTFKDWAEPNPLIITNIYREFQCSLKSKLMMKSCSCSTYIVLSFGCLYTTILNRI